MALPLGPARRLRYSAGVIVLAIATCLLLVTLNWASSPSPATPSILVDQFGYRPQDPKIAVIAQSNASSAASSPLAAHLSDTYQVIHLPDHRSVYAAPAQLWHDGAIHDQSGDRAAWFDFSELQQPGRYVVENARTGDASAPFTVADDVYRQALIAATRMFFYQRSGFPKHQPYADPRWTDDAAFLGPGQDREARFVHDQDNAALARDVRGGWFDAGDTNKYVTYAAQPLHQLLDAYTQHPAVWTDDFNLPESGNGIPDLLDEIQFELDWFQRMQDEDGGVFIKVGTLDYDSAPKPSLDNRPRFYAPKCSSSTIALAGVFAHAALAFQTLPSLQPTAESLVSQARLAWDWFMTHPIQVDCDTQDIKAGDADRNEAEQIGLAVTAAVYLSFFDSDPRYHDYIRHHAHTTRPFSDPVWSLYEAHVGDALLAYTQFDETPADLRDTLLTALTQRIHNRPDLYGAITPVDPYRAFMPDNQYHWGSNAIKANIGNANYDVRFYQLEPNSSQAFEARALGILHYLHGVNPFGMVYLTNMYELGASLSANEMYHEWFGQGIYDNAQTSPHGPAPGYLTGGPNKNYTGSAPLALRPPMRAYLDRNDGGNLRMWEITEPAIGYQSAYLKLLSKF